MTERTTAAFPGSLSRQASEGRASLRSGPIGEHQPRDLINPHKARFVEALGNGATIALSVSPTERLILPDLISSTCSNAVVVVIPRRWCSLRSNRAVSGPLTLVGTRCDVFL